jgi:mannonate dehydratase
MYVGTQLGGDALAKVGDRYLRQLAQLGVKHVCIDPEGNPYDWTPEVLTRHLERLDKAGLVLDMVQLPLPSSGIERNHQAPGIVLGKPGERDREIDGICRIIEALAETGIGAATCWAVPGRSRKPAGAGRSSPLGAPTRRPIRKY